MNKSSDFSRIASWAKRTPLYSAPNARAKRSPCRSLLSNRCASIAESTRERSAETQATPPLLQLSWALVVVFGVDLIVTV